LQVLLHEVLDELGTDVRRDCQAWELLLGPMVIVSHHLIAERRGRSPLIVAVVRVDDRRGILWEVGDLRWKRLGAPVQDVIVENGGAPVHGKFILGDV